MEATQMRDREAHYERKMEALVAEIRRHERVKAERGQLEIADKALHARARHIAREE